MRLPYPTFLTFLVHLVFVVYLSTSIGCGYDYAALSRHREGGSGGAQVTAIGGGAATDAGALDGRRDGTTATADGPARGGGGRADSGPPQQADAGAAGTGAGATAGGAGGRVPPLPPDSSVGGSAGQAGAPPSTNLGGAGGLGGFGTGGAAPGASATGGGAGAGGSSAGGSPGVGTGGRTGGIDELVDPVLWYRFDENGGTTVSDTAAFSAPPRNGALVTAGSGAGATFSTTRRVGTHSLSLTGNGLVGGGYAVLPRLTDLAPQVITISAWVFPLSNVAWQRVFDFGTGRTSYAFLTIAENADTARHVRFAITIGGAAAEETIDSAVALSLNAWHHLVVVLPAGKPYTGTLYVDGKISGSNPAMSLHFGDLGDTTQNYLGKSAYDDPYLSGRLDDFRMYRRALTGADVNALFIAP